MNILIYLILWPFRIIANIILKIFKGDKDKVPYPLLGFVIQFTHGGWAGVSIYMERRRREFFQKFRKSYKWLAIGVFSCVVFIFLGFIAFDFEGKPEFWRGFFQNFLSDIIVGVVIVLWVTSYLEKNRKRELQVSGEFKIINHKRKKKQKIQVKVYFRNIGVEKYDEREVFWDFIIDKELKNVRILFNNKEVDPEQFPETIYSNKLNEYWNYTGYTKDPIFPNQTFVLLYIEGQCEDPDEFVKTGIFYSLTTQHEKFPKIPLSGLGATGKEFELYSFDTIYGRLNYFEFNSMEKIIPASQLFGDKESDGM